MPKKCSPRKFHILWLMSGSSSSCRLTDGWMLLVQHWSLDLASQVPARALKKGLTRPRLCSRPSPGLMSGSGNTSIFGGDEAPLDTLNPQRGSRKAFRTVCLQPLYFHALCKVRSSQTPLMQPRKQVFPQMPFIPFHYKKL